MSEKDTDNNQPKYPKPKILLVDLPADVGKALGASGYNVVSSSFGKPHPNENRGEYVQITPNLCLPECTPEKDLVVINLNPNDISEEACETELPTLDEYNVHAKSSGGLIDSRPLTMCENSKWFDRILDNGGIFIVFAHAREKVSYRFINVHNHKREDRQCNNWSFLTKLSEVYITVEEDFGQEIQINSELPKELIHLVEKHFNSSTFTYNLAPAQWTNSAFSAWTTVAENKFQKAVAVSLVPRSQPKNTGRILVFPNILRKSDFLLDFLDQYLPGLAPDLFPYHKTFPWLKDPIYELPGIIVLNHELTEIENEMKLRSAAVQLRIDSERASGQYMHDLVTQDGKKLVESVQQGLRALEFSEVIDIDAELEQSGETRRLEDLQVRDNLPVILVEVKGTNGLPQDPDAIAVEKYVNIRTRESGSTHFDGLTIINHERHLPPLQRQNDKVFRKELVDDAVERNIGLMTAWDLLRLIRSFQKNHWKHEWVKELFYRKGRISPVPTHYAFIGIIERIFTEKQVVGIHLSNGDLRKEDRIAFELPHEFQEQQIVSMEKERTEVENAHKGERIGITTNFPVEKLPKQTRIYRLVS